MDRVYELLIAVGYPAQGVDWLRRNRASLIILLAIASWMLFIGVGWLLWLLLSAVL